MRNFKTTFMSDVTGAGASLSAPRNRSLIKQLFEDIARHRKISRDYKLLMDMPDYMLQDIGLTRFEIRREKARHYRILPPWSL